MKKLISVIIPVYNGEDTIEYCVSSITKSNYKNIEIIIIDDGSKDSTAEICKSLSMHDSRIKYVSQSNSGPSSARNTGLDLAKGEYVTFVDSDDYIESNTYEIMSRNIEQYSADISVIGYRKVSHYKSSDENASLKDVKQIVLNKCEALELFFLNDKFSFSIWDKLFRRTLFEKERFDVNIKMCEDQKLIFNVLENIDSVVIDSAIGYNHVCTMNSLSRSSIKKYHFSMLDVNEYIIDKLKNNPIYEEKAINFQVETCLSYFVPNCLYNSKISSEDYLRVQQIIKANCKRAMKTGSKQLRTKLFLYNMHPALLKLFIQTSRRLKSIIK